MTIAILICTFIAAFFAAMGLMSLIRDGKAATDIRRHLTV